CPTCRTESAFEEQAYKNIGDDLPVTKTPEWKLDFVATAEGFYSFTENRYIYQYKDQLGNARVSFAQNSAGALEITDTNNYYPLGLNHTGGNGINSSKIGSYNSYKYNGKELQETGMFDYGARFYMPDLGRWGVVDPLAEQMRRHSPYNYAFNNPVNYIDPDGRMSYNPRSFYGEHSAFNGDFDPNSTLLYGNGSFGYTDYTVLSIARGEGGGGGKTFGETAAYADLMDVLNNGGSFALKNHNGYMSWWTGGAQGDGNTAQENQ
ncbi:MAG: RHS repeat-associated core domain-containing protein, partial [Chryseobacterium sp.]|uniref:RHS repeat-associated core domain-containing protein n=1 Tax=Chryseobacterium sp. TaxID=1871047 RepID=UPI0028345B8B